MSEGVLIRYRFVEDYGNGRHLKGYCRCIGYCRCDFVMNYVVLLLLSDELLGLELTLELLWLR